MTNLIDAGKLDLVPIKPEVRPFGQVLPAFMVEETLMSNMRVRKDNHVAYTRIDFLPLRKGTMSEDSELAQRVANLMPKIIAALIEKGNEDPFIQTRNNNAYHMPMDLVYAYVKDFVNRTVFHCVHFWDKAIPAPGLTLPNCKPVDIKYFSLGLDLSAFEPGGPLYDAKVLTVRMTLFYQGGFMTYYKTDPISI